VTTSAGGQAVYPFVISPLGGTGMLGAVNLSVTDTAFVLANASPLGGVPSEKKRFPLPNRIG
jgi:hypothetical protein